MEADNVNLVRNRALFAGNTVGDREDGTATELGTAMASARQRSICINGSSTHRGQRGSGKSWELHLQGMHIGALVQLQDGWQGKMLYPEEPILGSA